MDRDGGGGGGGCGVLGDRRHGARAVQQASDAEPRFADNVRGSGEYRLFVVLIVGVVVVVVGVVVF